MERKYYLNLAAQGRRLPVATHLVLHQNPDPEAILCDGPRLAKVLTSTARMFASPLALPVMDLTLEKDILLQGLGIPQSERPTFHFTSPLTQEDHEKVVRLDVRESERIRANCDALEIISREFKAGASEIPVGMCIGPFSLLTKLLQDPITPIFIAGTGIGPDEDPDVALAFDLLQTAQDVVDQCCLAQIESGAKAIFVCEPAANIVYFSPNQMSEGSRAFEDFVMKPNRKLKELLADHDVDLIFHDCGELVPEMIREFSTLDPAIMSLGSPVSLWDAAQYVAKTTVLYGNLPSKKFYSDVEVPLDAIPQMVGEIEQKLRAMNHPFIVGSECDVLSVPGYETTIMNKVRYLAECHTDHGH